jgi:hypothetical protein
VSARNTLRDALASIDEAALAAHLRVSVPTLNRYINGELRMNWVICTRLASLPRGEHTKREPVTAGDRFRASLDRRRERRGHREETAPRVAVAAG